MGKAGRVSLMTLAAVGLSTATMALPMAATAGTPSGGSAATSASLTGVACASASSCMAVGYDANSKLVDAALAERWNGHTWALMVAAAP